MPVMHLGYHYVRDGAAPGPSCSPQRLERTILALKSEGYEFLTCGEVARRSSEGLRLPQRYATLSFDDGLLDQFTTAFPILMRHGVPGTFFHITSPLNGEMPPVIGFQILIELLGAGPLEYDILPELFAGTCYADLLDPTQYDLRDRKQGEREEFRRIKWMFNDFVSTGLKREIITEIFAQYIGVGTESQYVADWFMSAQQLSRMADAGMEIGSHSEFHPRFNVTGVSEVFTELWHSCETLREVVGQVPTFCYPFGGNIRTAVREAVAAQYSSAWNFYNSWPEYITALQVPADIFNIPRLHEEFLQLP